MSPSLVEVVIGPSLAYGESTWVTMRGLFGRVGEMRAQTK